MARKRKERTIEMTMMDMPEIDSDDKIPELAPKFDINKYYEEYEAVNSEIVNGKKYDTLEKKLRLRREYESLQTWPKMRINAARVFNVSPDHLAHCYKTLSGKVIMGVLVNDLIDRYGFSSIQRFSRADLATKYKFSSIAPIEAATEMLKKILICKDPMIGYRLYLDDKLYFDSKETEKKDLGTSL